MRNATLPAILLLLVTMGAACAPGNGPEALERVSTNGVEIAYRAFGPSSGEPILLIQGVGGTMPDEPDGFLRPLVDGGYRVIVFDNRDSGQSTHLDGAGTPDIEAIAAAIATGEAPPPCPTRSTTWRAMRLQYSMRFPSNEPISSAGLQAA